MNSLTLQYAITLSVHLPLLFILGNEQLKLSYAITLSVHLPLLFMLGNEQKE